MRERLGERREPGQETVFVMTYPQSAAFAALAAAATTAFLGLEVAPAASLLSHQLGCRAALKRLVVLDEVEAQTVDAVGGVDGGFDPSTSSGQALGLAAIEGVEEGDGDGGIVLGDAETHLVESIAGGRVAVLGEVADSFGFVAGAIGNRIEAEESPDRSAELAPKPRQGGGSDDGSPGRRDRRRRPSRPSRGWR
jgi:hypothetical protein